MKKLIFKLTLINEGGDWEEAVNFAKIKKDGIDIDELLVVL